MNNWNVFSKRELSFIHINIDSIWQKFDGVCYIANVSNESGIGISETKPDKVILSSEFEIDGYDLVRSNWTKRGNVACSFKSLIAATTILRLFNVLTSFPFTTSETMRDYYLYTWYIRVASQVAERLKT